MVQIMPQSANSTLYRRLSRLNSLAQIISVSLFLLSINDKMQRTSFQEAGVTPAVLSGRGIQVPFDSRLFCFSNLSQGFSLDMGS